MERQIGDQMGGKGSLSSFAPLYLYPHGQGFVLSSNPEGNTILGIAWLAKEGVALVCLCGPLTPIGK